LITFKEDCEQTDVQAKTSYFYDTLSSNKDYNMGCVNLDDDMRDHN